MDTVAMDLTRRKIGNEDLKDCERLHVLCHQSIIFLLSVCLSYGLYAHGCSWHQSTVYAHEGLYAHGINQTLAFTVTLLIATTIII